MSRKQTMVTAALALLSGLSQPTRARAGKAHPSLSDPALELTLFAADPDIVTPVGIASDARGRIFVVESHTHSPPAGYPGPKTDRIKMLEDRDGDGRAEAITVFADPGVEDLMNLAFGPDGTLYVAHRKGVIALRDEDDDGHAESVRPLLRRESRHAYDHSGVMGIAVGPDGWLYVSRGNVAGVPFTYVGSDGRRLASYGDGGHIVRMRPDGSHLQRFATGFWNPFGLAFDGAGRLMATDNDPDSRGPNRLIHVVPGGDYGYRARHGASGLHPHSAWNGELPGTLPFAGGVGESPAGLLDVNTTAFPVSYRDRLLVAVWAENSIELHRPRADGSANPGAREVVVKGDADFRPVAFTSTPGGAVFFTDWVKRDYPNHGFGRIWRLRARPGTGEALVPRVAFSRPRPDAKMRAIGALLTAAGPGAWGKLRGALSDPDPFLRATATFRLAEPVFRPRVVGALRDADARVRLGAMQTLRWAGGAAVPLPPAPPGVLRRLLADPDHDVRLMALLWTADTMPIGIEHDVRRALTAGLSSERLVRAFLATEALLTDAERRHLAAGAPRSTAGDGIAASAVLPILQDAAMAPEIHAMLLPYLGTPTTAESMALVRTFINSPHRPLQLEAVRTLGFMDSDAAALPLLDLARSSGTPSALRREAIVALGTFPQRLLGLLPLLVDDDAPLVLTLVRGLRAVAQQPEVVAALTALDQRRTLSPVLREAIAFARTPQAVLEDPARPATREAWWQTIAQGGEPDRGRQVFFGPTAGCNRCHRVGWHGGAIGPDLSNIASSVTRRQLLEAILDPSQQISPEFQAYTVETKLGEIFTGLQFHLQTDGATMRLVDGHNAHFRLSEITYGAADTSLMPQGLENTMTVSELRDLVAFLEAQR